MYRKTLLRKRMLRWAIPGPAYVPFIGDGDIAAELYGDRQVFGADLDPERVVVAQGRLRGSDVRVADCDSWPFPDVNGVDFAVADFDAYADPYTSFRSFWPNAGKEDRMVLFFTDGLPQGVIRSGVHKLFDGSKVKLPPLPDRGRTERYNFYLTKYVWPAFDEYIKPYRVLERMRYRRSHILYWSAAIERPATSPAT